MTDYNDGNWHGWNGGECPVHHMSRVDAVWSFDGTNRETRYADCFSWDAVFVFRVTKPYQEPKTYTGECFAYHYTSTPPALASCQVETSIPGKYTATHINGKLSEIVWKASE